jgi:hypothetical protein
MLVLHQTTIQCGDARTLPMVCEGPSLCHNIGASSDASSRNPMDHPAHDPQQPHSFWLLTKRNKLNDTPHCYSLFLFRSSSNTQDLPHCEYYTPSAFGLFEGIAKRAKLKSNSSTSWENVNFFEMSYYGEWQIEDEYEIRRIQTLVLRDRNSRLPLKDLVWVEEASIIFLLWRRKAIHGWKHSFWGELTKRIDCMGNITISPTSPIPHIPSSISMGISWMLQIRERDTMHNLFFNFG